MNSLELIIAMLINSSMACTALPAMEMKVSGKVYQVQEWVCMTQEGPRKLSAWRRECGKGEGRHWGHTSFLEAAGGLQWGIAADQFGGFRAGVGVTKEEAYEVVCGS